MPKKPEKPVSSSSQYWRDRAQVARTNADGATAPRNKRMLRGLAGSYERLAKQIEQSRDSKKSK
jgi:hypothetical protein